MSNEFLISNEVAKCRTKERQKSQVNGSASNRKTLGEKELTVGMANIVDGTIGLKRERTKTRKDRKGNWNTSEMTYTELKLSVG